TSRAGEGIQGYSRARILEIFSGKKVAFLGPCGTYSHEAVKTMFSAHTDASGMYASHEPVGTVDLLDFSSIDKVFDALKSGQAQAAVIPVANSTTGTIEKHFRQVLEEDLQVFAELKNPIQHCLWSRDKNMKLADIGCVYGHSQALQQCEMWMIDNLGPNPNVGPVCSVHDSSSAEALRQIQSEDPFYDEPRNDSDGGDGDSLSPDDQEFVRRGQAAIAGPHAGAAYGLHMIYENIQDKADNATTFWALCTRGWLPAPTEKVRPEHSRTHLSCFLPDSPGSLHRLTDLFCTRGLNMSSIQSFRNSVRHLPTGSASGNIATSGAYEHVFQIEVDGAFDHGRLIAEAAEQGLLVLWLGTTARE
nr:hypothetical protein [Pseudomonadota bacterium]